LDELNPDSIFKKGYCLIIHPWAIRYNDKNNISRIGNTCIFWIKNKRIIFDDNNYEKVKHIKWCIHSKGYVVGTKNNKNCLLHHLINGKPKINYETDHKNKDKLDNRKINLRFVTNSKNQFNKDIQSNNKSGVKGVCFDNLKNKWRAYIKVNNIQKDLGYFKIKNDAIKARKEGEDKYCEKINVNIFNTNLEKDGYSVKVKFVAVRGGIHDWTIYHSLDANLTYRDYLDGFEHLDASYEQIYKSGAKLYDVYKIKELVPCTIEAFNLYRF